MKYLFFLLMLFITSQAFAIFCPNNFKSVNLGDSMTTILQECGPPNSQNSYKKNAILSQAWDYYVRLNQRSLATSKMRVVFQDNRIINITLFNAVPENCLLGQTNQNSTRITNTLNCIPGPQNVASASCGFSFIRIGDTSQMVQSACGQPISVTQNEQPPDSQAGDIITEFKYNGPPAVTFVFENGTLIDRK